MSVFTSPLNVNVSQVFQSYWEREKEEANPKRQAALLHLYQVMSTSKQHLLHSMHWMESKIQVKRLLILVLHVLGAIVRNKGICR